ncbi:MAG: RNA-metabolising metallo-beta-lactamase [Parcubacteria group bacterium GW2011_GWA2_50_10b]|nr:MAG: RNA-metabolising metallo-beta-lactamase [Parcubacteria group bacterium GW2011_GWA2_50_10b]
MARLTCYGGAGATTGANFLLEFGGKKILVDCGMLQGAGEAKTENAKKFSYDPKEIDFLFITHAHIDHVGLIPKLYKEGFRGEIYSTAETKSIAELLLMDSAKINGNSAEPLYEPADALDTLGLWKTLSYHEPRDFGDLPAGEAGFKLELYNAGHVLGSAMLKLTGPSGRSMLFSGDIGNSPSPILPDVEKVSGLDYLLMESVYGDRNHESKSERDLKFEKAVSDGIKRGGTILIPAFSLERTQIILYELDNLFESGRLPAVPVFLDSPLAIRITEIYEKVKNLYNAVSEKDKREGDDIFKFPKLKETATVRDSREIAKVPGAKIIIAGSGMSSGGRILAHEEMFLPDPNSTIILAGYQAAGTLGRQIEEGVKEVVIDGSRVAVKAKVEIIHGFSAHADSDALVRFVEASAGTLKKVFVAMGEPKSAIFLAQRLRDELEVDAVVAEKGKVYELDL